MELEILSIPNKKTCGLYSCPTQLLKYVSVIISQPLATLLNVSVERDEHAAPLFTDADILPLNFLYYKSVWLRMFKR